MENLKNYLKKKSKGDYKRFKKVTKTDFNEMYGMSCALKEVLKQETSFETLKELVPANKTEARKIDRCFREAYIAFMGFNFINKEYVDEMSKFLEGKKVLEVMSGNGFFSKMLKETGVDIISTDLFIGENNPYGLINVIDKEIENIDAVEAIEKYGKDMDYVIMSWPPQHTDIASRVVEKIKEVNPDLFIIYIGESREGCTANDYFFEVIEEVNDENFRSVEYSYVPWEYVHDYPCLFRAK